MDRPTFLYDGDCAFCSACARLIERRVPTRAQVVAWQFTDLDALRVSRAECEESVQWVAPGASGRPAHVSGPVAVARLLCDAGGFWRPLGALLGTRPVLLLAWPVYRWISRNRYRLPGGTPACALPQAERHRPAATD
jgi:predicted DCC family thiol-disulfide oxidoreductase YuxK